MRTRANPNIQSSFTHVVQPSFDELHDPFQNFRCGLILTMQTSCVRMAQAHYHKIILYEYVFAAEIESLMQKHCGC